MDWRQAQIECDEYGTGESWAGEYVLSVCLLTYQGEQGGRQTEVDDISNSADAENTEVIVQRRYRQAQGPSDDVGESLSVQKAAVT